MRITILMLLALLAQTLPPAQPPSQPPVTFRVEVNYVEIDANVSLETPTCDLLTVPPVSSTTTTARSVHTAALVRRVAFCV